MEKHEFYSFAISQEDLKEISLLLFETKPFITSFVSSGVDIYNPTTYLNEFITFGNKTALSADLNLVTGWTSLVENNVRIDELERDNQYRLAAAIMAFAQCADISIEPNIALYEFAMMAGNGKAKEELEFFYIGDNIHPQYWTDFALGRSDQIRPVEIELFKLGKDYHRQEFNFTMLLKSWRRNYAIVLRIAKLALRKDNPEKNIIEIIKWMYEDFLFSAPALTLTNYYFSPRFSRKNLLKKLKSKDRNKAIEGIRNATWDLTTISEWLKTIKSQTDNHTLSILCTLDKKLREIALLTIDESQNITNKSEAYFDYFSQFWNKDASKKISSIFVDCINNLDNPCRKLNKHNCENRVKEYIVQGEKFILDWKN